MSWMQNNFNPEKHKKYNPKKPKKYVGREMPVCRSSWEYKFCEWCDNSPYIIEWSSETVKIPYNDPVKGRQRRYYPDFYVKIDNRKGKTQKYIIEIKPFKETIPPKNTKRKAKKTLLREEATWATNKAKWKSANQICKKFGYIFKIITEKELFRNA